MTLIGSREDWEVLTRDDERAWPLKDAHVACIMRALSAASPDAQFVEVDAAMVALRQTIERTDRHEPFAIREIAAGIADADERWWLNRAKLLGLTSIRPVEPWPRAPHSAA